MKLKQCETADHTPDDLHHRKLERVFCRKHINEIWIRVERRGLLRKTAQTVNLCDEVQLQEGLVHIKDSWKDKQLNWTV